MKHLYLFKILQNLILLIFVSFKFSIAGTDLFLKFGESPDAVLVYKVADRKMAPKDECCSKSKYTVFSWIKNVICIHIMISQNSKIKNFLLVSDKKEIKLPEPSMYYKMPNSPLITSAMINPSSSCLLAALDVSGKVFMHIDINSHINEINKLKHAISLDDKMIFYGSIPHEMYSK